MNFFRLLNALYNSLNGLLFILRNEKAFLDQIIFVIIFSFFIIIFVIDFNNKLLLFALLFFMPLFEIINTAIESVVDRIGLNNHYLSRIAKDLGSLCVFWSMMTFLLLFFIVIFFQN